MAADDTTLMKKALGEAVRAGEAGEVPVGAVIVRDGAVIASGRNRRIAACDGTAHAEIECIRKAGKKLGVWNLSGCELYVTLEPCAMCAGAIVQSRIGRVVFGAYDRRFGACGSQLNIIDSPTQNHRAECLGGVMEKECAALLSGFFKKRRAQGQEEGVE